MLTAKAYTQQNFTRPEVHDTVVTKQNCPRPQRHDVDNEHDTAFLLQMRTIRAKKNFTNGS